MRAVPDVPEGRREGNAAPGRPGRGALRGPRDPREGGGPARAASPRRLGVRRALALFVCLLPAAGTGRAQPDRQRLQVQFTFPPMPNLLLPSKPFLKNARDVALMESRWKHIEERKEEIDFPLYQRLRGNVEEARERVEAVERHAADHARQGRRLRSDVDDLKKKVQDFFDRLHRADQRLTEVKSREAFEEHVARFRSEYASLRRQWDDLSARANLLNRRMERDLKPEAARADRALVRVKQELERFIQRLGARRVKIGVAGGVSGIVTAYHTWGDVSTRMSSGRPVYFMDRIVTGASGRMQVLLLDETVFTIGPDSEMVLDAFVYDPFTQEGKLSASLTKGIFRFITGKIARKNPARAPAEGRALTC